MVSVDFTIVVQWLNFGILLFLLYILLYKPLIKFLDARNAKLKQDIETAEKNREDTTKLHEEYEHKITQMKREALQYMEDAKRKALEERENIVKDAHREADRIVQGSRRDIHFEAERIKQELKAEVAGLVVDCAAQVLEREILEEDHKRLIHAFIEKETKKQ